MFISTHNENRTTYNVVGFIEGDIELGTLSECVVNSV